MKRIVCVGATMVAMGGLASTAAAQGKSETAPNCEKGIATAIAASENRAEQAEASLARNEARCAPPTVPPPAS